MNGVKHLSGFDDFGRIVNESIQYKNNNAYKKSYTYKTITSTVDNQANCKITSNEISSEKTYLNGSLYETKLYRYELNGRLTNSSSTISYSHSYTYNNLGYLMSDNTTTYDYDTNGNILENGNEIYAYDQNCKNKLTSIHFLPITYENTTSLYIKSYLNLSFNYEGNRLMTVTNSTTNVTTSFTYDENGLRTKKTNSNGTESTYFYSGNRLVTEINTNYRNDYLYDENGNLFGFIYNKQIYYFYLRDITQNIIGIINSDVDNVVYYDYSAFGSVSTTGTLANTIGKYNPFRFKGYYYDVETQLFYCNSRYYSPELCRFISPDSIEFLEPQSINDLNLYCYCMNNPVNYKQRPVSSGGSVTSSSISVGCSSVSTGVSSGGGSLGGVENPTAPWWPQQWWVQFQISF